MIMSNAFQGEYQLRYINLERCKYLYVPEDAFDNLPSLKRFFGDASSFEKDANTNAVEQLNARYNLVFERNREDAKKYPRLRRLFFIDEHYYWNYGLSGLMWLSLIVAFALLEFDKSRGILIAGAISLLSLLLYLILPGLLY